MSRKKKKEVNWVRKSCKIGYTTQPAFDYATKHVEHLTHKKLDSPLLKKMNDKKIKIVIKVYQLEEDVEPEVKKKSKRLKRKKLL